MMFPKPVRQEKQRQPYNTLQRRKKDAKPVPEWKQGILAHHKSKASTKDRGDFPRHVIDEIKAEAGGKCQCCLTNPDTTTHHVMPRGRMTSPGRGVKTNSLRLCWPCHDRIQTNVDELNYWIEIYHEKYGFGFWFDEEDWNSYNRMKQAEREANVEQKQRMERINPVVELLTASTGRKLKVAEIRLIDGMDEREVAVFARLMGDVVSAGVDQVKQKGSQAYGHYFED